MAINPSSLEYQYRRVAGGDNNNQKATYAVEFSAGGQNYTFIPDSVITSGVQSGKAQYIMPWFLKEDNLGKLGDTGQRLDLSGVSWYGDYLKDTVGASPTGFLVPSGSLDFDSKIQSPSLDKGRVQGVVNTKEGLAYAMETPEGTLGRYIPSDGKVTTLTKTGGSSLLGGVVGSWFDDLTAATGIQDLAGGVNQFFQTPVGKAMLLTSAAAAGGAFGGEAGVGAGAGATGGLSGTDLAMADLAASTPAFTGAGAATTAGAGGLMAGGSTGTGLQATGGLGLTGGNTANLASMGGAQGLTGAGTTGATLGATGGALTAGGIGAGLGLSEAAAGTGGLLGAGAAAGAGGLTASQMANAGLISGGLNLAGGLLQGQTSQDAARELAAQQAALAEKTLQMGKFQPVGVTTRFGTSAFTTDPVTGAITPSYTLSPEAKAYQDALSGMATQGLTAGQGIMNLGQQYVGESPEAVRQRYIDTQRALLAPGQEQSLAALRNRQAATGRGGLATGATSPEAGGLMATNPEMAAYYNSLAQTERQLAANAETQYQNQVNFGTGLLGQATTPFTNVFGAQRGVELAAQQPLELSTNFANTVATRGAAQGANYAAAMAPSLQAQYNANNFNPFATTLQGAGSNPLTGYGLMKLTGLA
jgi:hypothetical protein